jgi:hypothetical protein
MVSSSHMKEKMKGAEGAGCAFKAMHTAVGAWGLASEGVNPRMMNGVMVVDPSNTAKHGVPGVAHSMGLSPRV